MKKLAKHKKMFQAALEHASKHQMEMPPLPPKKPGKKRRVIKGRI